MYSFSIVTVTKNSGKYLRRCLTSLENQNFSDFHCVWIDCLSSDNTLEIFNNSTLINKSTLISEQDNGLYDAFNKALSYCHGKYVLILNSDDYLISNNILSEFHSITSSNNNLLWVCGGVDFINKKGISIRKWIPELKYGNLDIFLGWMPPHSCSLISNKVYSKLKYDTKYKISSDYDFFIHFIKIFGLKGLFCSKRIYLIQQSGGTSNGSLSKFLLRFKEDHRVRLKISFLAMFFTFTKSLRKIVQLNIIRNEKNINNC